MAPVACGPAKVPNGARVSLPGAFAAAFRIDATGDARDSVKAHLDVVGAAARAGDDPWQAPALEASLDALALRTMPSLGDASRDAPLAFRTQEGRRIEAELARVSGEAAGPFAKGLVARALQSLAEREGDATAAEKHRAASGCVREALVIGPTTWASVTGIDTPGPLDRGDARLQASYAVGDAFGTQAQPIAVRGRGCAIDLSAETVRPGLREVVVDLEIPEQETIGLVLRARGAAVLRAGGEVVARRAFELGDGEAAQFVRVAATRGKLRLVARVGTGKEDDAIEIDAWGADGAPLRTALPAVGSSGDARVTHVEPVHPPTPTSDDELLLFAASALAAGNPRDAERALWPATTRASLRGDLALLYGRAIETARDLSPAVRAERGRSAYERVLEAWPTSWEALIAHAVLAGVRRGHDEAGIEELHDLDTQRKKMPKASSPWTDAWLDAFEALTSGHEHLFDRARAALGRARVLSGTPLLADAENEASPRVGAELVTSSCDPSRRTPQDTFACFDALRTAGDRQGTAKELARLRSLLGAPERFQSLELHEALAAHDDAAARRVLRSMLPAEQTVTAMSLLLSRDGNVKEALLQAARRGRDAPAAIAPLLRQAGEDPTVPFEGVAEQLAAQDRAQPILSNAATAILTHSERYDLSSTGILHWILYDVRRVSGTTDVEENAQAAAPEIWGRASMRALRRRILKKDGRILEPDRTPHASQAHADLSQLEQGDIVEAFYEGWSLPGDTGDIGFDTPDVLPERAAIHEATIELRLPGGLRGALWSHALLGKAEERTESGARVLGWHLSERPARRVEDGVPKMDRSVGVSFSTAQWSEVGHALRETIATLDEHDPEIAAWAREAVGGGDATASSKSPRAAVEAIVTAAGKALREADPGTLSDYGNRLASVQTQTARTALASHDGSRSWLVLRSLRELGVPCDLLVAENDPFSADPSFPPHFGRFVHPLVVAHVGKGGSAGGAPEDLWIDADVAGPPLPVGRVSPELRGRFALRPDGTIEPLPSLGSGESERDEVDVRVALDARGTGRGTFAIVLRGREAQELSEALLRIVGAERQRALRDVVLAWLPWADVDEVQLASNEGSWEVSLRADVSVSGYAQLEGAKTWLLPGIDALHWAWPHARVASLASAYATRAGRESALALSTAVQYHVHRRVELPAGASIARMPGPLNVKGKLVDASRKIAVQTAPPAAGAGTGGASGGTTAPAGLAIEDDFVLGVSTGTISAKDYDAFAHDAHAVDDGFLASMRVLIP
jgi:hypothetical protein